MYYVKGVPLSDGRKLGGTGGLTDVRIDCLQGFYAKALYANKGNPTGARSEIMAGLYHYAENHEWCPTKQDTWCKYKYDQLHGTSTYQRVKNPLTQAMVEVMKPIYEVSGDKCTFYLHH